jgi:lysine-N-methylase
MADFPIRLTMLPVIQRWDCHTCGSCCQEYQVRLSHEEANRIRSLAAGMRQELGGLSPLRRSGWFSREYFLNHTETGACVFLDARGLCKLQEKHGYESKPLPCRLFPWVLIPRADRWTVGVRFACPSAAENKGRPVPAHTPDLERFALELVSREGISQRPGGDWVEPPMFAGRQKSSWWQFDLVRKKLLDGLENSPTVSTALMRSLRWIAALRLVRGMEKLGEDQFGELAGILWKQTGIECDRENAHHPEKPDRLAGLLFRQCAAVHTRKDHGPKRGLARSGPIARLGAILRFSAGSGRVPRLHGWMPDAEFEKAELAGFSWDPECQEILRRYYWIKINAGQFAGNVHYRMSVCDGFSSLALTFPIICWITRLGAPSKSRETLIRAISIVDDHFGFNRVLGGFSQRMFLSVLSNSGRLERLIRWYAPERY